MRLALYQPDMPQNLGAVLRIAACFATPLELIEPCGFPLTDKALRRAAMDYAGLAQVTRHASFRAFRDVTENHGWRLILLETDGQTGLYDFKFAEKDVLILGQESCGSAPSVYGAAHAVVRIPIAPPARSLNVAVAGAIALAEALRQTKGLPA